MTENLPQLFTPEQLAAQLGTTVDELRRLRENGTGPAYITIGPRLVRYLGADVSMWLGDDEGERR
ncbi:DNA-binding protein (plasmid) [Humibacter sp. BT305]|nr:DNA-binding protein [Humibacter sp. BT305]